MLRKHGSQLSCFPLHGMPGSQLVLKLTECAVTMGADPRAKEVQMQPWDSFLFFHSRSALLHNQNFSAESLPMNHDILAPLTLLLSLAVESRYPKPSL